MCMLEMAMIESHCLDARPAVRVLLITLEFVVIIPRPERSTGASNNCIVSSSVCPFDCLSARFPLFRFRLHMKCTI